MITYKRLVFVLLFSALASQVSAADSDIHTLPENISFIKTFGSWEPENGNGMYRLIMTKNEAGNTYSEIFIQWMQTDKDTSQILKTSAISVINEARVFEIASKPTLKNNHLHFKAINHKTNKDISFVITALPVPGEYEVDFTASEEIIMKEKRYQKLPTHYVDFTGSTF